MEDRWSKSKDRSVWRREERRGEEKRGVVINAE